MKAIHIGGLIGDFDEVPPNAASTLESMRAQGYSLSTAVADLIDNSIAAGSNQIRVVSSFNGNHPWLAISDDGRGMSEAELKDAMRIGSRNPLDLRAPSDLGRFGLGLKTAAFSQARRLTVWSRKESEEPAIRRWDLDHLATVNGWQLLRSAHAESTAVIDELTGGVQGSGTVVLLERMDRFGSEVDSMESCLRQHFHLLRQHLAMVFHRYLSGEGVRKISLSQQGTSIEPWDPFCRDSKATKVMPSDSRNLGTVSVFVKGYVLPHRDRFGVLGEHELAGGPGGWNAQQGFYLYRAGRLIVAGDWLGLGSPGRGWTKEEHYKLARLSIDIPNSVDANWQIDIKKSRGVAPPELVEWLTGKAREAREIAKQVYAHRGRTLTLGPVGEAQEMVWLARTNGSGRMSCRVNRAHSLVRALRDQVPVESKKALETLLKLVEAHVPVQQIWIAAAENQDGFSRPFDEEPEAQLREILDECAAALVRRGQTWNEACAALGRTLGFDTPTALALIANMKEREAP
jgi:Histidine kinase-, DNA gyrase B-, and HSP90-like ATPase